MIILCFWKKLRKYKITWQKRELLTRNTLYHEIQCGRVFAGAWGRLNHLTWRKIVANSESERLNKNSAHNLNESAPPLTDAELLQESKANASECDRLVTKICQQAKLRAQEFDVALGILHYKVDTFTILNNMPLGLISWSFGHYVLSSPKDLFLLSFESLPSLETLPPDSTTTYFW